MLGSASRRSAMKRLVGMVEVGRKRTVAPGRRRGSGACCRRRGKDQERLTCLYRVQKRGEGT